MTLDPHQVKAIFLAALDKAEEERAGFLDEACAGEPDLQQRVERLLLAHDRPDSLPEAPAAPGPTQDSSPPEAAPTSASLVEGPGAEIGLYKDDLKASHRYNAACAAALASCGVGKDADKLDGEARARLRRQALTWLRADLEAWGRLLGKEPDKVRPLILRNLRHWLTDTDFAGVRGPEGLAQLPEAEQQSWRKLWDDVAATLAKAQNQTTPEKKSDPK
jgi:serine/threonine-protein kinase